MRSLLLAVTVALGGSCAHLGDAQSSRVAVAELLRRENRTEIARIDDVPLGEYRGVYGATASMKLSREGDHLVLTRNDAPHIDGLRLTLQEDGTFAVPGHYGAWLSTRGGTTTLTVSDCYMFAIYQLES
jgi:hypothetical protein